jgi:GNAT superfamily N-acetyltransferase
MTDIAGGVPGSSPGISRGGPGVVPRDIQIRRLTPELVTEQLLRPFGPAGRWAEAEPGAFLRRARTHAAADDRFIGIAYLDGEPVGAVEAQDYGTSLWRSFRIVRMHDLFVTPDQRRQGIGRELVAAALRWAGARPDPGFVEWQASPAAVPFYESLGLVADYVTDVPDYPYFIVDFRRDQADGRALASAVHASSLGWL